MSTQAIVSVECGICGRPFPARAADVRRGHGKYCGTACTGEATRRRLLAKAADKAPNCVCAQCGTPFYRAPSKVRRGRHGLDFCHRDCKDRAQSLAGAVPDIRPAHYGTAKLAGPTRYRRVAFKAHGRRCNRCGWDELPAVLQVHHRNRDQNDNRAENLEVLCPRCHDIEHFTSGDGRWTGGRLRLVS